MSGPQEYTEGFVISYMAFVNKMEHVIHTILCETVIQENEAVSHINFLLS
jgi:hypothetical protein